MFVVPYSCFIAVCVAQYFLIPILSLPFILSSGVTLFLLFTFLLFTNQLRITDFRYIKNWRRKSRIPLIGYALIVFPNTKIPFHCQ